MNVVMKIMRLFLSSVADYNFYKVLLTVNFKMITPMVMMLMMIMMKIMTVLSGLSTFPVTLPICYFPTVSQ